MPWQDRTDFLTQILGKLEFSGDEFLLHAVKREQDEWWTLPDIELRIKMPKNPSTVNEAKIQDMNDETSACDVTNIKRITLSIKYPMNKRIVENTHW
jgi:hypothetical protein